MLGSGSASVSLNVIESPGFRTPEFPAPSVTTDVIDAMTGVTISTDATGPKDPNTPVWGALPTSSITSAPASDALYSTPGV